jgi:hypothetical protein
MLNTGMVVESQIYTYAHTNTCICLRTGARPSRQEHAQHRHDDCKYWMPLCSGYGSPQPLNWCHGPCGHHCHLRYVCIYGVYVFMVCVRACVCLTVIAMDPLHLSTGVMALAGTTAISGMYVFMYVCACVCVPGCCCYGSPLNLCHGSCWYHCHLRYVSMYLYLCI